MSDLTARLDTLELLELQTLLEDYSLSEFNGFLHGIHSFPTVMPLSEWLNDFLPEQALKTKTATQRAAGLLLRYYDEVVCQADETPPRLDMDGSFKQAWQWLSGFGQAFAYDSDALEAISDAEAEENQEDDNVFIAAIILGFAMDIENAPESEERDEFLDLKEAMKGLLKKQKASERIKFLQGFVLAVKELLEPARKREMQRIHSELETSFGPNVKLGRNDPCYCGSGKKYKHCHAKL